jgi:lysophospholipase L1-like esterase
MVARWLAAGLLLAGLWWAPLGAEETDNPAARAVSREKQKSWLTLHEKFVERARKGDVDVVFLGDSITRGWAGAGKKVWAEAFEPLKAANFGIGGDQTGHVLWRITAGKELDGINPKVAVVMIGTNNTGGHTAEQIAGGVKAIVEELRKQKPEMKVLLLGVFPRREKNDYDRKAPRLAADQLHPKIKQINALLARLDDGKGVVYKDIGGKFLDKEGGLPHEIMPDYLHLSEKGYRIWADAITDDVKRLLK